MTMRQVSAADLVLGVNVLGASGARTCSGDEVAAAARAAEQAGFDVVTAADHLGSPAPFAVLAAAGAVTERVRLRSYVLDAGFWNPALLAREAATLDALSGGRLELGLGAGHMRHEHEDAGLPFPPLAERVEGLERTITEVRRRLDDPGQLPQPVRRPVPIVVGCWGTGTLGVAARQADVVALGGLTQVPGEPAGTFRLATGAETAERVATLAGLLAQAESGSGEPGSGEARSGGAGTVPAGGGSADSGAAAGEGTGGSGAEGAGGAVPVLGPGTSGTPARRIVLDALLQRVVVDRPPEQAAAELAVESGGRFTEEELLDTPFLLLAPTPAEAAAELLHRSRRYGITSWMTHGSSTDSFALVLRELRSRR